MIVCQSAIEVSQQIEIIRNIGGISVQTLGFSLAIVLGLAGIREGGIAISRRSKGLIFGFLCANLGAIFVWILMEFQAFAPSFSFIHPEFALFIQLCLVVGLVFFLAWAVFDVLKKYVK